MNNTNNLKTNAELFQLCEKENLKTLFNKFLKRIGKCEKCGTADYVSYLLVGEPTEEVFELTWVCAIVALGGCSPLDPPVNQKCRKCGTQFIYKI